MFFFKKKNQKTFICFGQHRVSPFGSGAAGNLQKFFAAVSSGQCKGCAIFVLDRRDSWVADRVGVFLLML
jgi:hypothetical protein